MGVIDPEDLFREGVPLAWGEVRITVVATNSPTGNATYPFQVPIPQWTITRSSTGSYTFENSGAVRAFLREAEARRLRIDRDVRLRRQLERQAQRLDAEALALVARPPPPALPPRPIFLSPPRRKRRARGRRPLRSRPGRRRSRR